MKGLATICIAAGVIVLAMAVIMRLANIAPLIHNPVLALWRVSVSLLLVAIAVGVNKK